MISPEVFLWFIMRVHDFIGFPAPLLGQQNVRLQVYHAQPGFMVVEKPVGVISEIHPWYPSTPVLVEGLRHQANHHKPELEKYQIEQLRSVYFLESEVSGAALLATTRDSAADMRNWYGSYLISFRFSLLVEGATVSDDSIFCDLPLAPHASRAQGCVSHKTGKKCATQFRLRQQLGRYALWEAETSFFRPHQIRIHADEVGLGVVGENIYRNVSVPSLNQLRGCRQRPELDKPLYHGVCIHLESLSWTTGEGDGCYVNISAPRRWSVLYKHLTRYA